MQWSTTQHNNTPQSTTDYITVNTREKTTLLHITQINRNVTTDTPTDNGQPITARIASTVQGGVVQRKLRWCRCRHNVCIHKRASKLCARPLQNATSEAYAPACRGSVSQ